MCSEVKEKLVLISLRVPKKMYDELENLVARGLFPSKSEAIRHAIRNLLLKEREQNNQYTEEEGGLVVGR
jgi:Arc/MetJ-type ribon-helix-helix transcriptional regulator